jgi:hypothetical protein
MQNEFRKILRQYDGKNDFGYPIIVAEKKKNSDETDDNVAQLRSSYQYRSL